MPVVGAEAACELPNPLDGIELRTIGRQEVEDHPVLVSCEERLEIGGMMVTSVVQNQHHEGAPAVLIKKLLQEGLESCGIELICPSRNQAAFLDADRAEHSRALSSGGVKQNRVGLLGRDPHPAARAVLLEMAFVQKPEINSGRASESAEFFYMFPGLEDHHER